MANMLLIKVQEWLRLGRIRGFPYRYILDPTNICNLRCPVCPTGLATIGRERGSMDFDRFQKITNQIARYAYRLELCNFGEPLLHPRIFDMINYAHQRKISVMLSSNLNFFDQKMAEQTVTSGLDMLIVSVDGATQETYEKYRVGGNLSRVLSNARLLVEEKHRQRSQYPIVIISMLINRHNEHQISEMRQIAKTLGVDAFTTGSFLVDTTDPIQVKEWLPIEQSWSCYDYSEEKLENVCNRSDLWESMTINWDGGVVPCCWLHRKENDFENIFKKPLAEVWNSEAYISSRRLFAFGGPKVGLQETICTRCKGKPSYMKD